MLQSVRGYFVKPAIHETPPAPTTATSPPAEANPAAPLQITDMPPDILHNIAGRLDDHDLHRFLASSQVTAQLAKSPGPIEQRRRTPQTMRLLTARIKHLAPADIAALAKHLPSPLPDRIHDSIARVHKSADPAQSITELLPILDRSDVAPQLVAHAWQTLKKNRDPYALSRGLGRGVGVWYKHFPNQFIAELKKLSKTGSAAYNSFMTVEVLEKSGAVYGNFSADHKVDFMNLTATVHPVLQPRVARGLFASWDALTTDQREAILDISLGTAHERSLTASVPIFGKLSQPRRDEIIAACAALPTPTSKLDTVRAFIPIWSQLRPHEQTALLPHFQCTDPLDPSIVRETFFNLDDAVRQAPHADLEKLLQTFGEKTQSMNLTAYAASPTQFTGLAPQAQLTTLASFAELGRDTYRERLLTRLAPALPALTPEVRRKILAMAFGLRESTPRLRTASVLIEGLRPLSDSAAQADIAAALATGA